MKRPRHIVAACATELAVEFKLCSTCGGRLPIDQFDRRRKGEEERRGQCRACSNERRKHDFKRQRERRLGKFLSRVTLYANEPSRAETLVRATMKSFGGMSRFVGEFHEWLREARAAGKHHLTCRAMTALLHLFQIAHALESQRQPDVSRMTEDDVSDCLSQHVVRMVAREPQIALWAASELGWHVEVPDDLLADDDADLGDDELDDDDLDGEPDDDGFADNGEE